MKNIIVSLLIPFLFMMTGCGDSASVSSLASNSIDSGIDGGIDGIPIDGEEDPIDDPIVVDPVDPESDPDPIQCTTKNAYVVKTAGSTNDVTPYRSPLPADVNYNYYSWSGHPIVGSTPAGYEGQFFLYEDGEGGISFNFLFSVDAGGSVDNQISLDVVIKDNDSSEGIILSDDRLEIKKISSANGESVYQAKMRYWKNTDGGIIGPVTGDNLSINVKLNEVGDTANLIFYSADGEKINLGSDFEILANGSVDECSVDVDKEIKRNSCIEKEYLVRKTIIEDAKWMDEYDEMIKIKKEKITEFRKVQKTELVEVKTELNKEVTEEVVELREIIKISKVEERKLIEYYETKLKELTEIYKKKKEVMIEEFDVKIKEVQAEERKQVCKKGKGLFGFLKKLFCHIVKFVGKVVGAIFKGFEGATMRFLEKYGFLNTQVTSSIDLIRVKELAISTLMVEYDEEVKSLIEEKELKLKELIELREVAVKAQKEVIVQVKTNRTVTIKKLVAKQKAELKAFVTTLNKEIKDFRTKSVKVKDAVHKEFTESITKCL